jgi:F-type H+-transporting ATPase subunit delta
MIITAIAKRYARALADVAAETNVQDSVKRELDLLTAVMAEHAELAGVLRNPAVPEGKKVEIITGVLELAHFKMSSLTGNFLGMLIANRRMGLLGQILAAYQQEMDLRRNVVAAELITRFELGEKKQSALAARLQQALGRTMRVSFGKDESIIGGVILRIGSTVYDGSIRRQLEEIQSRLVSES